MTTPHRKRLKHFEGVRQLHELTFSCFERRPLLLDETFRCILSESLKSACVKERFRLIAFVFMPEHVHLLVIPNDSEATISRLLACIKQPVSKQIRQILVDCRSLLLEPLTIQERPGKICFRFWQEGAGFDRNLYSPHAVASSIDYIHANPVRRGLCERAVEYKWSSARFHELNLSDPELPDLVSPDPEWFHPSSYVSP